MPGLLIEQFQIHVLIQPNDLGRGQTWEDLDNADRPQGNQTSQVFAGNGVDHRFLAGQVIELIGVDIVLGAHIQEHEPALDPKHVAFRVLRLLRLSTCLQACQ